MSSSGSNTVTGTSSNDNLNGGSGDDVLDGGAGSDKISAGSGNDTLDGGSGSDSLNGGSGNDTLVYNVTENIAAGTRDVYTGGSGVDTVVVEFTLAQWLNASTQTQIQQYLSHLSGYTNAKTGEVSNGSASDFTFTFGGSTLTVQTMEQLKVFVDGIELNPADQAVLALNDAATLGEDAAGVVIDVLDNDFVPDLVGHLQVASQPAHGTVAVLNNGAPGDPSQWTLKYTPEAGAWNHLAQGETATETFTYRVTDADGDISTATVTLTLTGMNDAVLITPAAQAGAVVEDAQDTASPTDAVAASGTISFSDADLSDGHGASFAAAQSTETALGTFSLAPVDEAADAANGTVGWSYALDSAAAQALAEGEVVVEKYDVTVSDGHGGQATQTVTITITGTNDRPVATGDTGATDEGGTITGTVAANDHDVDHGAVLSYALVEPVAGLSLQADGSYSFDAGHTAYQHLAQGATTTVVANYTVTDEHGAGSTTSLTITLTGTNDVPVAVADTGSATEDTIVTGSVAANDTDADDGAALSYSLNDPVDGLTLNADGSYSFDAGSASYQHLAQGATATVVANYTATDQHGAGSTSTLTITLTGTNDVPVAVADIGSATEDSVITGSVATNDSDVDDGAVLGYTLNDPVDGLTLNADGTYSFDAGNASYQHLAEGATAMVAANYTVTDQHGASSTSTLTITLTGTNDTPVAVVDTNSASEDTVITGSVATNDSDVDDGAILSYSLNAPVDGLTLDPDGSYSFDAGNAAYQHLAQGATATVVANYTVTDQHGASNTSTLTITLTGTNDVPVAVADTGSATEDIVITGSVAGNDSDVDDGAVLSYALNAPVDGLTLNADGSYSFNAGHSTYQHLAEGATTTVAANYTVTDDHGATSTSTLTITLTGTNDVPVAVADTGSATEDTVITGSVATNDSDLDVGAILSYSLNEPVAGLTLDADGSYSFDAGNVAYQHLAIGATATVVANYTVTDDHGATSTSALTITLTGSNDVPLAVVDTNSATEDTVVTGSVATNDSDVDDGAVLSYALNDPVDGLTLNTDGSYSFDAGNAAYQHLAEGATATVVANYTVTDQHGAGSTSTLTITLTGTNDVPVAVVDTGSATEDTVITGSVATNDSDVDDGAVLSYTLNEPVNGLTLNANGTYSFDSGNASYQHLAQGATATVVANYTATDQHGASSTSALTIALTGTNDAPTITSAAEVGAVVEDAPDTPSPSDALAASGTVSFSDADLIDGHTAAFAAAPSNTTALGVFALAAVSEAANAANGTVGWSYVLNNAAAQSLAAGEVVVEEYDVTVSDSHGGQATQTVTITIAGTNDVPTVGAHTDGSVVEDAGATSLSTTVSASFSDIDLNDTLTFGAAPAPTNALGGTLTLSTSNDTGAGAVGSVSYLYSVANSAVQYLAAGQTATEAFTITASDGHGGTASQLVTVTVTGTNDVPNLRAGLGDIASVALGETDAGLSATGTLTLTDADLTDVVDLSVLGVVASGTTSGLNLTNAQLEAMFSVAPVSSSADADAANNVTWTFNSGSQAFDYLGAGQSLTLTYTVHASDAVSSDDQTVTVTINGSNDAATNLTLTVTQAPSNNSLPSGDFATITAADPDGGAGAYTYSLLSLTEYSSSVPGASPTVINDSTPDLSLASNGYLTANGGIETNRTYELQVQVAQGTSTYTETFSIITGTTGGDTINGTNNAATAGDDAVYLLNGGDIVFAGSGDDSIFGQNGNDSLHGGEGNDLLHGGGGNDTFFFESTLNAATNVDTLADFDASADLVSLSKSVFGSLSTAAGSTLASSDFGSVSNGTGATASFAAGVHVIYDSQTGNLFYDADGGSSASGRTLFAVVGSSTHPSTGAFNQSDIFVGA